MSISNLLPQEQIDITISSSTETQSILAIILSYGDSSKEIGFQLKKPGDAFIVKPDDQTPSRLLVTLGEKTPYTTDTFRKVGGQISRFLISNSIKNSVINPQDFQSENFEAFFGAFIEGMFLGSYRYTKSKTHKKENGNLPIHIYVKSSSLDSKIQAIIDFQKTLIASVNLAREWEHEPANIINPVTLAARTKNLAKDFGLKCTILDDQELIKLGAGAITAVGKGSPNPSRMIILEYPGQNGKTAENPVVLVGKAITFDTGGYSIKNVSSIQGMKYDKCGGINVIGTLIAAASLKLRHPLVGIVCAAENMISGDAYRPDDIVTTLSGKTVEIITTDAEGRLVLADGITYAQNEYHPKAIIDLATLTGGVVTALGKVRAGLFSNNDLLADDLFKAGEMVHERLWRLPIDEDYATAIEGNDADLKNSGGKDAHPIMGAIFLKQFVENDLPWAHLDIAGVADVENETDYYSKGATGFGVRLLIQYLLNQ